MIHFTKESGQGQEVTRTNERCEGTSTSEGFVGGASQSSSEHPNIVATNFSKVKSRTVLLIRRERQRTPGGSLKNALPIGLRRLSG